MTVDHECDCGCSKAFQYRAFNYDKPKPPKSLTGIGFSRIAQPVLSCASCGRKTWIGKTEFRQEGKKRKP